MRTETLPSPTAGPSATSSLYRRIWRWHFFAGLFCLPFILSLAITGALYLFHQQIDDWVYAPQMLRRSADLPAHAPSHLVASALRSHPGTALAYKLPRDVHHNVQIDVMQPDGATVQVFVDPASATVSGSIDENARIMTLVRGIHSMGIAGTGGKVLIEIVAGWIIVLVSTGVYLWWPRGRRVGVVSIRAHARGRVWWRDLHAVTGAFAGIVILFLALTGMPWSVFWGEQVNTWLTEHDLGVPKGMWVGVPHSTLPARTLGDVPWAQQHSALPASTDPHAAHRGHGALPDGRAHAASLDAVVDTLATLGLTRDVRLVLPRDAAGVYSAIRMPAQLAGQRVVHLDQYSGKVLMDIGADRIGPIARVTEWGVSVHQGGEYGTPNLLVMLAACLGLIALCISGMVTWWKRRPAGQLAAPTRKEGDRLAKGVLAIAIVLGLCFPLLGASMLAVLLADLLAARLRRPPPSNSL